MYPNLNAVVLLINKFVFDDLRSKKIIPTTEYAIVDSTNGPPIAAPTPMFLSSGVSPKTTATNVTILSGKAVPNAARIVPVAF